MDSSPSQSAPETISARLRVILLGWRAVLGLWLADGGQAILLYRRIGQISGQIERMLLRFRAGRLRCVAHRAVTQLRRARSVNSTMLPRRFGWLVLAGKHEAACFGLQLQMVLNEPEMLELLAASPQARRVLRPLCRALAMEVPGSPAKPARADTVGDVVSVRKRRTRVRPEPFRIPLPRGALTWARREGFGRDR